MDWMRLNEDPDKDKSPMMPLSYNGCSSAWDKWIYVGFTVLVFGLAALYG